MIPSILTNLTAAEAYCIVSSPTVNRRSTDSQTQRHYTLTSRLTRLAALFLMLLTLGVGQMWGTRKFKTGERIYFKDAAVISGSCMKYAGTDLWAVFDGSGDWIKAQIETGSWNTAGTIYYFDVPQKNGVDYEFSFVIFTRNDWNIQTGNETTDVGKNLFTLSGYNGNKTVTGSWGKYAHGAAVIGDFNDWDPDQGAIADGRIILTLEGSETYAFKVLQGEAYCGVGSGTITNTTADWWHLNGANNVNITTGEAGEYCFHWNSSTYYLGVYYPQARFAASQYIYFNVEGETGWKSLGDKVMFWTKYYDSGSNNPAGGLSCNTPVETYVYYAQIPNNDYIGQVQLNRYSGSTWKASSAVAYAYNRSSSSQNCMIEETGKESAAGDGDWTPQWTTYCPPTTSETFADNSTPKISWQPNTNDGSSSAKAIWVKTNTALKVAATASKAVADPNMTIKYDFKVDGTSRQNTTTATYTHSASTNNTTYELSADIYTNYNLDNTKNSTKHTQSSIFYKALNTYSVTHTLSNVTKSSGRDGADAAAYYVAYDATYTANTGYYLPSDITVTIGGATMTKGTDYTWTVTDGTSGSLSILANKINGNVVITINAPLRWAIATSYDSWNTDDHIVSNISTSAGVTSGYVDITLPANTGYELKVFDKTNHWLGHTTSGVTLTYSNSGTQYAMAEGNYNLGFTTAGAGSYRFTWDITNSKVSVTYPTSYYVTAAGNPAAGGTVTPSSATYMSTSVGGEITATPNYAHYFNGWTSSAGGTFTSASSATTTFKPASAAATVTAAFPERTAFIEGNFQVYNSTRATRTKTGDSWQDASTAIKMTYDSENNRYYLHTYSTPAELAAQLNSADAYFYVKTSTSSSSIANAAIYRAYSSAVQSLTAYGSSNKKATGSTEHSFKFTGSEDGYVIIYFNGTHVWYELECALSYYGGEGTTGDAPAARTYYAYGSNQTAASNTYSKTGYSFDHWDTAADDSGTDYDAGATNVAMNAREVCLHAQWEANDYTINLANMEATTAGTESVTVTFDASTNMTASDPITKPTKTHYDFGGYWTSEDTGETLDHQLIGADGKWIKDVEGYTSHDGSGNPTWVHDYPISLYAKWTEHEYAITMAVSPSGAGTTSPASTATGKLVTESGNITATPAAGYKFKEWQFSKTDENYDAWCADGYSSTDATIHIKAQHNGTLTAVFEERYSLVGSLYDGSEGGMPGWEDYSKTFTVNSSSPVDLTRTCTLQANKTYKLQVHDLATSTNLGRSGCTPVCVLEENASLVMENSNNDVFLYTSGAGEYIFKITAVDGSGHPTLTVLRPYPVNFGQKYLDIDGTLHTGTTGGTAAATAGSALSSGDYVTYNTSVTHTATPAGGYTFAGWWSSDAFEGDAFSDTNPMTYAVTSGDNTYAKFVEKSTSVTLANDGHGKVQISSTDKTNTTCGVTTTRELTAVPNDGYKFSSWSKSGDDITLSSTSTNPTTLSGNGSGATSGQTVTANFVERYSIKGTMNGENWGTTHTLSNIGTNAGSKDTCYVTMTLPANTTYEFAIYDEQTDGWYKAGTDAVYDMTYTNHTNWEFGDTRTYNCGITTAGKGTYKFIFNITDKTVTVVYPTSYQVNYGASVGGSVTSVEDGDGNAVPNGGYVVADGSVTYTAAANDGYTFVGWCNNDSYGNTFTTNNPWTNSSITATSNAYAKFKSTNFVIYRSGDKDDDPRAALDDVESYAGGTISETIEFRMKVRDLDMWHTLCLPFEVNAVKVWEDGEYYDLVPFYRTGGTYYTGDYIIRTPEQTTDFPIADFDNWNDPTSPTGYLPSKNTPYIIQWHHSYFAEDGGRYISFFGESEQTIPTSFSAGSAPSSDNVVNVHGNNSMQIGSVAGAYLLENDYGSSGAWLRAEDVSEARTILPFECYILVNSPTRARYMAIRPGMTVADTPTGWDDVVNSETKTHIVVYSISGVCLTQYSNCSINEAGQRLSESYGEGLYILRTDNESVKLMVGGK